MEHRKYGYKTQKYTYSYIWMRFLNLLKDVSSRKQNISGHEKNEVRKMKKLYVIRKLKRGEW